MRGAKGGEPWTEELSSEPRAYLYHNFLSKDECDHLISLAKPHMKRSRVVDLTGGSTESSSRTSTGMFLTRGQDKVIQGIEKRIADCTSIPRMGRAFKFSTMKLDRSLNPTLTTPIMVPSPKTEARVKLLFSCIFRMSKKVAKSCSLQRQQRASSSFGFAKNGGISVKPKMGDALLFWSMKPDGSRDPKSEHGANPVMKGNKWSATKWLHVDEFKLY